jgi:hypothetical protein
MTRRDDKMTKENIVVLCGSALIVSFFVLVALGVVSEVMEQVNKAEPVPDCTLNGTPCRSTILVDTVQGKQWRAVYIGGTFIIIPGSEKPWNPEETRQIEKEGTGCTGEKSSAPR